MNKYGLKKCPRCTGDLYTYNYKKIPFSCIHCGHQFYYIRGKFEPVRNESRVNNVKVEATAIVTEGLTLVEVGVLE